jgi:hypothetical protein
MPLSQKVRLAGCRWDDLRFWSHARDQAAAWWHFSVQDVEEKVPTTSVGSSKLVDPLNEAFETPSSRVRVVDRGLREKLSKESLVDAFTIRQPVQQAVNRRLIIAHLRGDF